MSVCGYLVRPAMLVGLVLALVRPSSGDTGLEPSQSVFPTEPPAGAVKLWNGRDLSGWKFVAKDSAQAPSKPWEATDSVLRLAKIESLGYIRTEASYQNYHLHVEWRWPDGPGNSGVMLHLREPDDVWPTSLEAQLKSGNAGQIVALGAMDYEGGTIERGKRRKPRMNEVNEVPQGEWNRYDIIARDGSVELYINGRLQNRADKLTLTSGYIGLQLEGAAIEFRNLWLKPL